jgi:prolyl-tRNA synthetase
MRLSKSFWQTYKEDPSDAEITSHKLLMRSGMIHKTAAGIYSYLPFAVKCLQKIQNIVREEMNKTGGQEINMSFVTPAELWKESGRWDKMGLEMLRIKDRKQNDFCLSPTNEETVTDIFKKNVSSYKNLPVNLYQISTKFRDEVRPRFGLMRGKEFTMKDAYTFSMDKECMDEQYDKYYTAYANTIKRMGLEYIVVEADGGTIAAKDAKTHEFQVIADSGEDTVVQAKEIGFAANLEKAQTFRGQLNFSDACRIEDIETKGLVNCEDVCTMLDLPVHQSLKTLVFTVTYGKKEVQYMILLLGDDALNEIKLINFLGADELQVAKESVLEELGVPKGFMSPYKLEGKYSLIYDESIDLEKSYIVGANKIDYHIKGFVPARDTQNFKTADLRLAKEGDFASDKKTPVVFRKGIEVGHIFQLGDKYSKSMNAGVLDKNGKNFYPLMGCYGIGITRMMAAAIEQHHDENGIVWPMSIAPYQVYFVVISKSPEFTAIADEVYETLLAAGIEIIYDDRKSGPGPKFKDADLLGIPLRLTFGERDYKESKEMELKVRSTGQSIKLTKENTLETILNFISELIPKL